MIQSYIFVSLIQICRKSSLEIAKIVRKGIKKRKVREFHNNVFTAKNASTAVNYLEEDYIQHNPTVPSGREGFINAFIQIFEQNPNA
jgi:predicted SnoaL-like aldol condensation-catalyzing enzyme